MQAVILAAGKGSRLHPITTNRSKAMLPILGKPIVERVMEHLANNGIGDFILVVSPDDTQITRYFHRESQLDADVRFAYQPQRLGMADALRCASRELQGREAQRETAEHHDDGDAEDDEPGRAAPVRERLLEDAHQSTRSASSTRVRRPAASARGAVSAATAAAAIVEGTSPAMGSTPAGMSRRPS